MASGRLSGPVLIVGAGLAGLTAARHLVEAGLPVLVVDKGRGLGGRLATRRIAVGGWAGVFDHGAQFFTARDPRFTVQVDAWRQAGVAREWSRGFAAPGQPYQADGHPRYIGVPAMTALARQLAAGLAVRTRAQARVVARQGDGWAVTLTGGETLRAAALVLTPPVPQSLALLEAGGVALPADDRQALQALTYEPCLAVLVVLDGASRIPEPGAIQFATGELAWMADNSRKGLQPQAGSVTLHASAAFSRRHWADADEAVQERLLAAAGEWLGARVLHAEVKRWRYARPERTYPQPHYTASREPPLLLAGDAFGGPRLEGAYLSGLQAAQALLAGA
jgi:predicted NAD/FAD-dependent oxidoreductase